MNKLATSVKLPDLLNSMKFYSLCKMPGKKITLVIVLNLLALARDC